MRLSCIREARARNEGTKRPDENTEAASQLFERGMLAREAIASGQSALAREPAPQQLIVPLIDAVIDSARP
jgi:hypothetical protein